MKNRIIIFITPLLMCALMPVQKVLAQTAALTVVGDSAKTTTTADTDDITFTVSVSHTADGRGLISLQATVKGPEGTNLTPLFLDSVTINKGGSQDVTITAPRWNSDTPTGFKDVGTYTITFEAKLLWNLSTATQFNPPPSVSTDLTLTVESPTIGPTNPTGPTQPVLSTGKVVLSEFMFETGGGETPLPQWIEVYNNSSATVNLRGWKLQWESLQPSPFTTTITTFDADFRIPEQQARLIVTALGRRSSSSNLADDSVIQSSLLHILVNRSRRISGGFSLKLINPTDAVVDNIGTLSDGKKMWGLPETLIEGTRSSLIRRFDEGVPRSGIEKRGWIRAFNAKRLVKGIYYGSPSDHGTPGYRRGKPLPIELSQFSARLFKDEVIINWTTESELNNAGFNIYRSTSRTKNFQRVNTKLIQGAGTTGQRSTYQFIDKTAQPDVSYYYRLEDVELTGTRGIITTYRLRGAIAPNGKRITTWGTLKDNR